MSHPLCSDGGVKTIHPTRPDLNPDHHIWNNNGTWWLHATVHHPDYTKERVRVSLGTKDRVEARRRRDFILRGTTAIVSALPRTQAMPDLPPLNPSAPKPRHQNCSVAVPGDGRLPTPQPVAEPRLGETANAPRPEKFWSAPA
jgi:hypothetical protein